MPTNCGTPVTIRPRSEEEIWELVRGRAIDQFTRAIRTFIGRCRGLNLTAPAARALVESHPAATSTEARFNDVAASVFGKYLHHLESGNAEDFSGLLWRAVARVNNGGTAFSRESGKERGDLARARFLMVDEFQDFSPMFFALVDAIVKRSRAAVFAVGDDWQAINGFAGSDLKYFSDFDDFFPDATHRAMPTNYRSATAVVNAGNALMKGLGAPGRPKRPEVGQASVYDLAKFDRTTAEEDGHGDTITPAVLRLVKQFFDRGEDVVLLSRDNRVGSWVNYGPATTAPASDLARFRDHLRSAIPQEDRRRLTTSTTHSYKGLQSAAVIVVDATAGRYPLVHPSWSFSRVFGESIPSILDAERRLFYVALTRAENSIAIVTERGRRSPFLDGLGVPDQPWPAVTFPSPDGARLEVRVSNAYNVREELKALGYRFGRDQEYEHGKYWRRSCPVEGFELATLRAQSWARPEVRIEVFADGRLVDST